MTQAVQAGSSVTIAQREALLRVDQLRIEFSRAGQSIAAVEDVSFEVGRGEIVCLLGESGSGKSLSALAIIGLLPAGGRVGAGAIEFDGQPLHRLAPRELHRIRGRRIAMVFQEPMTSLHPLMRIGDQIIEAIRIHRSISRVEARKRAVDLLTQVGVRDPATQVRAYPHQLSGGMQQRVLIAMAIASEPDLLIADEPTTALDPSRQGQVLDLLAHLRATAGLSVLLITHDVGVVAQYADSATVLYAGRAIESASVAALLARPRHPYTRALLHCAPRLHVVRPRGSLPVIQGEPASVAHRPGGCAFHPRCTDVRGDPRCAQQIPPRTATGRAMVACWHADICSSESKDL